MPKTAERTRCDWGRAFLPVQKEFGSLDACLWSFVGGRPRQNARPSARRVLARAPQSDALSRDLTGRRFRFVGTTICHAFMQAAGLVNDHTRDCFRHRRLGPGKAKR